MYRLHLLLWRVFYRNELWDWCVSSIYIFSIAPILDRLRNVEYKLWEDWDFTSTLFNSPNYCWCTLGFCSVQVNTWHLYILIYSQRQIIAKVNEFHDVCLMKWIIEKFENVCIHFFILFAFSYSPKLWFNSYQPMWNEPMFEWRNMSTDPRRLYSILMSVWRMLYRGKMWNT